MGLVDKIIRNFDEIRHNIETQLEYKGREDRGTGCVDVLVYEYNKITKERKYLHTVPVKTVPTNYKQLIEN